MIDPKLFLNDISPIDHGDGSRYFYKDKGVPSVTELLSFIDNQGLIDWANMVGRKGQNNKDIVKRAAEYGTNSHAAIECYLKNKPIFIQNSSLEAFKEWWKEINSCHRVKVIGQEESLVTEFFAGTYDLLMGIDDKPYLVDFKTSNHVTYKYFMQLAAYRHLLYVVKKININGCVVLQLGKGRKPKYNEYVLDFNNPYHYEFIENCFRSFMGLVYTYYNVKNCQSQFNDIFKYNK